MTEVGSETWERLGVSRESVERLDALVALTVKWQRHINLIAPSTVADIWIRHVLDSAQLLPLIHKNTSAIADLGSGGGFPALVLAAIQPAAVHMFESNAKKSAFLAEALRQMGVKGAVHTRRLERNGPIDDLPKVQLVTARAFAPLNELLGYAEPFFRQGATGLFHKGQDIDAELATAAKSWTITAQHHSSLTDSHAVILEVKEIAHVNT